MLFYSLLLELRVDAPLLPSQKNLRSMSEKLVNLYSTKYFYTEFFNYVTLRIIISLVGFLKPFTVCMKI